MHWKRQAGFSLVELAVVLIVAGLILAIGAPPLIKYLNSQRVRDSAQVLREEMRLARQKAVTNGTRNWVYTQWGTTASQYWTGIQTPVGNTWPNSPVWSGPVDLPARTKQIGADFGGYTYFVFVPNGRPVLPVGNFTSPASGSVKLISTSPSVKDTVAVSLDLSGSVW